MIDSSHRGRGEYTDDTQMALLIAESLLEKKAFVGQDIANRFESWARTAPDVGLQTRAVVTWLDTGRSLRPVPHDTIGIILTLVLVTVP